jgi:hypothetical protein
MIKFIQHSSKQYPPRTYENASADITLCFAFDFNTPGERLTRDAVINQGRIYLPIRPFFSSQNVSDAIQWINEKKASVLNIAGNGLYTTIKKDCDQNKCDEIVFDFLNLVLNRSELNHEILLIRSGGQSGFDEAGLKAAVRLGIPALCLCPNGWRFRDGDGNEIFDEKKFKERFAGILAL